MKKIYGILCLGIIFSTAMLRAQPLNGVYTIDNTLATSATNFTSFTQFASTLNAQGVSGPVVVNVGVASGPYTEQIEIFQFGGSSATNSVVINGNGRIITFNATNGAARHTILLSGADNMVWNNLQVFGTNTGNALVVHLWNGSDNNSFNNMYIEAPNNGSSTTQVPFSISGGSVSATTAGVGGSNNTVNSCTIVGGYYNTVFYGNTTTPNSVNNEVRNSVIRDFYVYGFYNAYATSSKLRSNRIDRVNRTLITSTYAIYLTTGTLDALIDANHVRDLFTNNFGSASVAYNIYVVAGATSTQPNLIRNNVVSDINNDGTLIGIYLAGASYAYAENNTISLDYSAATVGTSYGIYVSGPNNRVRNNNITISRAGSGSKWGLYYTTAATNMVSDYNNIYIGNTTGTYGWGYYNTTTHITLAAWRNASGQDMKSMNSDPQYASPSTYDYSPTNVAINNRALMIGLQYDINNATRSHLAPDPGAYEFFTTPCSGAPPSNSFVVPSTSLCPNMQVEFALQNTITYTNSGYVVQWYSSTTTSLGPFTAIPGATLNSYLTIPITTNIHYQAVITCAASNQSITTPPGSLFLMPTIQDTVPYHEDFEVIGLNGFPNCNWTASSIGAATRVNSVVASGNRAGRNSTGYAYFENKPLPNYFYTNQIYLKTGVTYSAALWYITDNLGYIPWADLSILVSMSQAPGGQLVASKTPTGQLYNSLSNTFSVATTGYYYVAVRATGDQGAAPYLTWDDLSITIPCQLNSPTLSVLAPTSPVCQGMPVSLQAGGANAYTWSNGTQGPSNVVTPLTHSTYVVHGFNTLSWCSTSVAINLTVTPSPVVGAIASDYSVCSGQSTTLTATGADTYYWSTGSTSPITVVSPTIGTFYDVAGTNSTGCTGTTQVYVDVYAKPLIIASPSSTLICLGESVKLSAQGANSYMWLAPNLYATGSEVTVTPQSSTMYTLTSTTQEGCSVSQQMFVIVDACTGLAENKGAAVRIFPNPAADHIFVQTNGGDAAITITDVSGRVIASQLAASGLTTVDLTNFSAGVYYIQLQGNNFNHTEKFIRQ